MYTVDTGALRVRTTVSSTHAINNAAFGFQFYGDNQSSALVNSVAGSNGGYGIVVSTNARLTVSHAVATSNKLNDMNVTSAWVYSDATSYFQYDNLAANVNYYTVPVR